ncbi:selenide, water dikinase SelD [Synechococcus sp. MIT S9508]|uniref:selenide, water dikinase SelD n=1 Tax=Synechococcus sp. MIT S9508 TaxID=1801629 RepID=UPI0007BBD48D|nr:selenide, water dikinase SelD [Synechococcus sp. MIT S9508]KZR90613.1 Selenide, water dikinase [Synechococcus sp. MIT S9508]
MSGLVLAGGGHSHALVLRRWAMQPRNRPKTLITLVSRTSTALYSGMVPGLVAGLYSRDELAIDLRRLADQAGVAFVQAEITGIDLQRRHLGLLDRPALHFEWLSLNLGCVTPGSDKGHLDDVPIKPLEHALIALEQRQSVNHDHPIEIVGSGLAAIELALALRHRWPSCPVALSARPGRLSHRFKKALNIALVQIDQSEHPTPSKPNSKIPSLKLRCTGSRAPDWLETSGLPVNVDGRVLTDTSLQVLEHPGLFAAGDCGVIGAHPRPASGVWAVQAAAILARNLEAICRQQPLRPWRPQHRALQLVGGFNSAMQPTAWAVWGPLQIGPHRLLWSLKERIDRRFMRLFKTKAMAAIPTVVDSYTGTMLCRGCAAKLPAKELTKALSDAGVGQLATAPEDAAELPKARSENNRPVLQSVDGFPALVSDPWLNGRLTALHASSDLWACGAKVQSAQAVITLPLAKGPLQQHLLSQTLAGIRSALEPQEALLIGGHTLESRSPSDSPVSMGVHAALTIQGSPEGEIWSKKTIQIGDQLLLSRRLGTGVLFAAAMAGACKPKDLDQALTQMATSQQNLVDQLRDLERQHPGGLHAATDITGFGLLGHLGEMLPENDEHDQSLDVEINAERIPALPGALELLEAGYASSIAPANRNAWQLLTTRVKLDFSGIQANQDHQRAIAELLIDPQTCGPLLISVNAGMAEDLLTKRPDGWWLIGTATHA